MPVHPTGSRRALLAAAGAGTVAALPLPGAAYAGPPVDTVLEWYDLTAAAVGVITGPQQVTNSRTWAIGWIAAWRALSTVDGRRAPEAAVAPGVILEYSAWHQLTRDNIDARIWSGIHFRHTDEIGARVGRRVAAADLARWHGRPL
jgi:hypothetical protein